MDRNALGIVSTLKVNALRAAIGAYEKGSIPFAKIQDTANELLKHGLDRSMVTMRDYITGSDTRTSVKDYLKNYRKNYRNRSVTGYETMESDKTTNLEDFSANSLYDMERQAAEKNLLNMRQEDLVD